MAGNKRLRPQPQKRDIPQPKQEKSAVPMFYSETKVEAHKTFYIYRFRAAGTLLSPMLNVDMKPNKDAKVTIRVELEDFATETARPIKAGENIFDALPVGAGTLIMIHANVPLDLVEVSYMFREA